MGPMLEVFLLGTCRTKAIFRSGWWQKDKRASRGHHKAHIFHNRAACIHLPHKSAQSSKSDGIVVRDLYTDSSGPPICGHSLRRPRFQRKNSCICYRPTPDERPK